MKYITNIANIEGQKVDQNLDRAFNCAWLAFKKETFQNNENCYDIDIWQKRFHCKILRKDDNSEFRWTHIEFENKGEYMLFLLEWV
jgi:hypothetical protein